MICAPPQIFGGRIFSASQRSRREYVRENLARDLEISGSRDKREEISSLRTMVRVAIGLVTSFTKSRPDREKESRGGVLRAVVMCIRRCIPGRSIETTTLSSNPGSFRAKKTRNRVEVSCSLFLTKCYRAR